MISLSKRKEHTAMIQQNSCRWTSGPHLHFVWLSLTALLLVSLCNVTGAQTTEETPSIPTSNDANEILAETQGTEGTSLSDLDSSSPLAETAGEPTIETDLNGNVALVANITIFVLAVFVGFELITKVPPTLHTPLMSGSNAISGITLVGALLAAGSDQVTLASLLGTLAVILATINVVGGFMVTDRMLGMFRKK